MLATMAATSMGMIPPLHSVRTAFGDERSDEWRRRRRPRGHQEMERGRPEFRRRRPYRRWREVSPN